MIIATGSTPVLLSTLLPAEDEDMGKTLARRGIKVQTGRTVSQIAAAGGGKRKAAPLRATIADPDGQHPEQVEAEVRPSWRSAPPAPSRSRATDSSPPASG